MQGQVGELRKEIARYLSARTPTSGSPREAGRHAKGRSFEELVHDTIDAIAQAQGDAAHHTGDTTNESGSKKGDTVVEIGGAPARRSRRSSSRPRTSACQRTTPGPSSTPAWASATRPFAVLVVAGEDKVPAGLEELTEYQGNK